MSTIVNFGVIAHPDIVLVSTTDNGNTTEFHVHKNVLADASSFFCGMFALPEPLAGPSTSLPRDFLQRIHIPESPYVMDAVLRLVYPGYHSSIPSLSDLTVVLAVAVKYDIIPAIESLRTLLLSPLFLETDPLHAYAIACRFSFDEEARLASGRTLGVNLLDDDGGGNGLPHASLRHISAYDYHRLIMLHRRRAKAACALLRAPDTLKCMYCNGSVSSMSTPPKWWESWVTVAQEELTKGSATEKIFSTDYVFEVARKTGCTGCSESVLHSWGFLTELKEGIDHLPSSI